MTRIKIKTERAAPDVICHPWLFPWPTLHPRLLLHFERDSPVEEAAPRPPGDTRAASSWFCRCYTGRQVRGSPLSSSRSGRGPWWSGELGQWSKPPPPPSRACLCKEGTSRESSPDRAWPFLLPLEHRINQQVQTCIYPHRLKAENSFYR